MSMTTQDAWANANIDAAEDCAWHADIKPRTKPMTNETREKVERHLDISHNHEAGLIPVATANLIRAILAENEALKAAQVACVKPLDWHDYGNDGKEGQGSVSDVGGLTFYRASRLFLGVWELEGDASGKYQTLEEAKAAAQADYERRILSALA